MSTVVPCHNEEDTIGRCLNAIFGAKHPEGVSTEVIVVNDRSVDRSAEIAKRFPIKLVNKTWSNANNLVSETVNLGIENATGDYVAIVEADIEVPADWLIRLLPHFENNRVGKVSGYVVAMPNKTWFNKLYYLMHTRTISRAREGLRTANMEVFPVAGFSIFRRSVFENLGLFDETIFAVDIMFDLRMRGHGYTEVCDLSVVARDMRQYTATKFVQTYVRWGRAMYQTGGSLLRMHEELIFRYVVLSPHYCLTLFRYGRSLVALLFPLYALIRYFATVIGYLKAVLSKERKCPDYLRKKRKEHEIRFMLDSFRKEIRKITG